MATGKLQMLAQTSLLPIATFPILKRHASSGAETPEWWILTFLDSASRHCYFRFQVPPDYASDPVLKIRYSMVSAVANEVRWNCNVCCGTPTVDDMDTAAAGADNVVDDTVPGTAGIEKDASIALANADGMAAEDTCILKVGREGGHGNDDAAGDAELAHIVFEYTTT